MPKIWLIVLVAATTLIIGGGAVFAATYFYFNPKLIKENQDLSKQIDGLKTQVTDLEKQISAAKKDVDEAEDETAEKKDPTAGWKTYTNNTYHYSFKYPTYFTVAADNSKKNSIAEDKDHNVSLQGDMSNKGWPMIDIAHYNSKLFNITAGADLLTWLKKYIGDTLVDELPNSYNYTIKTTSGKTIKAVKSYSPQSPQAYSNHEIYFVHKGKMIRITMLDVTPSGAKTFYNNLLSTFRAID